MIRDLRHACRAITRMPGLAAVVILSLGVGIGVNTVVFSWIQAVVFRPIPGVRDAAAFYLIEPKTEAGIYPASSWREYKDLAERIRAFNDLVAFKMVPLYVGEPGHVERGNGLMVSGNYFPALGLEPSLGRLLRTGDVQTPGGTPVAVISHDYWQTRFRGDPGALGQRIRINGQDLTIVGVAPRRFQGTILGLSFDLWLPATMAPVLFDGSRELDDRSQRGYSVMGRLSAGASLEQARSETNAAMRELGVAYPQTNAKVSAEVRPFWESPRGPQMLLAAALGVLQAIMLLLLLSVCGNTANLVLARASARHAEMSVRLALGAGRWRVARLLLVENVVLALAGAGLGAMLAWWGTTTFNAIPPLRVRGIPIMFRAELDWIGLLVATGLGLGCGVLFGLIPALQLSRIDPQATMRGGGATAPRSRVRLVLMATEVALAVVVLVIAGSFMRSFMETRTEQTGFRRDGILLAAYDLTGRRRGDESARLFAERLVERLQSVPSVSGVAIASAVPLDIHGLPTRFFTLEGRARDDGMPDQALTNAVTPGYFAVMEIPIVAGRDFSALADATAPPEAVVNEEFVRRFVDRGETIGRRLEVRGRSYAIVGVVRNSLYNAFGEPPAPAIYLSYRDRPAATGEIHLRSRSGHETAVAADVRRAVRELDPELPLFDVRTLNDHIEANLIFRRIPARLFTVIGPLLLLLAAIGIYAVGAYTISLRTAEIGVRLALGASGAQVVRHFVLENLGVVAIGAALGWATSFVLAVDVLPAGNADPVVFGAVPVLIAAVATLACWLPARRAALVDPLVALREG